MKINTTKPLPEEVYFHPDFMITLDSHLSYLRSNGTATMTPVSHQQGYKYEGDLYGLLDDIGISKVFHRFIARINGYVSSSDFKGDREYLIIPSLSDIEMIKSIYQTKNI